MTLRLNPKKAVILGLGVVLVLVLMNLAWTQLAAGIGQCFSSF